jgi:putative ATP-binding cassette transporter
MGFIGETYRLIAFLLGWARNVPRARISFALVLLTGLIAGLCNTALIAIINASWTSVGSARTRIVWGFIALCVALPISRLVSQVALLRLATGALREMRMRLSRRILQAPLRLLEEIGSHRLLATLTEDIPAISGAVATLPLLCMHVAIVASCLAYLCYLSRPAFLGVLFFLVLGVLTYQMPLLKAVSFLRKSREKNDELYKSLRALTQGVKELKLHSKRREEFLDRDLSEVIDELQRYHVTGNTIYMAAASWGQILFFVLIGLLIFALPGFHGVGPQALMGYTLTLLYMMTPLEVILSSLPAFGRASAGVRKIESLGLSLSGRSPEVEATPDPARNPSLDRLELVGVTQSYRREGSTDSFTLGPIDLSFVPGELLFLTGGNGCGKTTLAKLIVGLYTPESGEIRLNDRAVTDETRDEYRQMFSVVFSDFHLFESLLGLETTGIDERARQRLVQLRLEHKVSVKEGALSTLDLSQGERKRLALLTAYLEDRPINLFDEWAADQDPYFREIFYRQLLPELKAQGKTVIVISHDDRYFHLADRVIKLDYGKIVSDQQLGAPAFRGASADMELASQR